MRLLLACLAVACVSLSAPATFAGNPVHYIACRADNETEASVFGIDEAAKKVCDREAGQKWFAPMEFDAAVIEWSDGASTKVIYRSGKHRHYEHNILLLNHVGHCSKVAPPAAPLCAG